MERKKMANLQVSTLANTEAFIATNLPIAESVNECDHTLRMGCPGSHEVEVVDPDAPPPSKLWARSAQAPYTTLLLEEP